MSEASSVARPQTSPVVRKLGGIASKAWRAVLLPILIVMLWSAVTETGVVPKYVLPSPRDVLGATLDFLFGPGNGGPDCPSGYKGRAGIYQVMPISDMMKRLIIEGANAVQLADQSRAEGIWEIRTSGLAKVRAGVTSLAEVNRVTVE